MEAFGWPTMVEPVPVALARLDPAKIESEVMPTDAGEYQSSHRTSIRRDTPPASGPDIPARARAPVAPDKRLAQRAGILCTDPVFHKYLSEQHQVRMGMDERTNIELAAAFVRQFCKVESRSEITLGSEAATRIDLLESAFVCWRDLPDYIEAAE